jgi:hypothetical protein
VVVLTLLSLWRGHGQHLGLLSLVYIGYNVSYLGSLVGLIYGFVDGLIFGRCVCVAVQSARRAA